MTLYLAVRESMLCNMQWELYILCNAIVKRRDLRAWERKRMCLWWRRKWMRNTMWIDRDTHGICASDGKVKEVSSFKRETRRKEEEHWPTATARILFRVIVPRPPARAHILGLAVVPVGHCLKCLSVAARLPPGLDVCVVLSCRCCYFCC